MQERIRNRASLFLAIFLAGGMLAPVLHSVSHALQFEPPHEQTATAQFADQGQHHHRAAACSFCGHLFVKFLFTPLLSLARLQTEVVVSSTPQYIPSSARLILHLRGPPSL